MTDDTVKRFGITREELAHAYELHQSKLLQDILFNRYVRDVICHRLGIDLEKFDVNVALDKGEIIATPKPPIPEPQSEDENKPKEPADKPREGGITA